MTSPIGVGLLRGGTPHPSGRAEYPAPYPVGTPVGEHLRVESLMRIAERRIFTLCNNLGPKWSSRKCWACGNIYSPDKAQSCNYCLSPLRDLRLLMTTRWNTPSYEPFEAMVRRRLSHANLITPIAVYYREGAMLTLYQYDGEALLVDEPAPFDFDRLIRTLHSLCRATHFLHQNGVALAGLAAQHVLVMPDRSVRLFDPEVQQVFPDSRGLREHPARPEAKVARDLCLLGLRLCGPESDGLRTLLESGVDGAFDGPVPLGRALHTLHQTQALPTATAPAAAYSDLGLVRSHNEDSWTWRKLAPNATLLVVADGMGGHEAGEVASALACQTLTEKLSEAPLPSVAKGIGERLTKGFEEANRRVRQLCDDDEKRMGTTLVAAILLDKTLICANAGDSRAYVYRATPNDIGVLEQVSRDHTIVQDLIEAGKITKAEAKNHPRANVVTSTIGSDDDDLDVFTKEVPVKSGDRVLLCSDGLWNQLDDERMAVILYDVTDPREAVRVLIRAAYSAGANDNVSAIVYDVP